MEQFDPTIINDVSTCDDAKAYVATINDATDSVERIARNVAFSEHVAYCATCINDGLFAIEGNDT